MQDFEGNRAAWSLRSRLAAAALLMVARAALAAGNKELAAPEYKIKAALLFQFTQLAVWPVQAFPEQGSPFVVGILGDDPFGAVADQALEGKTAQGRTVAVQRFPKLDDFLMRRELFIHVLFISASEKKQISQILSTIHRMPVLTVGEVQDFTALGGMINFSIAGKKVRFEINEDREQFGRIEFRDDLLRMAKNSQALVKQK